MANLQQAQLRRVYRGISWLFVVAVVGVVAGALLAGWSSAAITVVPKLLPVTETLTLTVAPKATNDATMVGNVKHEQQSATVTVEPKSDEPSVPAHAKGHVVFTNTT